MGRDWEIHVYYEHAPLTPAGVQSLLAILEAGGLTLDSDADSAYPTLPVLLRWRAGEVPSGEVLEDLLRVRPPPLGPGYGVVPLRACLADGPGGAAFLSFGRPDRVTGLDRLMLVLDGALFQRDEPAALGTAFDLFVRLCADLEAVYGWSDWETATFLEAAPTARDVRAGVLPRLLRFNALNPTLLARLEARDLYARTPRVQRLPSGMLVFERAAGSSLL
jgi:hypothetical protein